MENKYETKSMRTKVLGVTLVETMFAVALFSILMLMLVKILTTEARILRVMTEQSAVNQSALRATIRLRRELSESNIYSVTLANPATATVPGIVFMSPREAVNNTTMGIYYDPGSTYAGKLQWKSYICYYRAPDPRDASKFLLKKKVKANTGTVSFTGNPPASSDTPQTFSSDTTLGPGQVITHDILSLDIYWWNSSTATAHYGTFVPGSDDALVYISICCKRQNVATKRTAGVSRYDEVIYGLDRVYPVNSQFQ